MRTIIANYALRRGLELISRYRQQPEGFARSVTLWRAATWNVIRQLARPVDRAVMEARAWQSQA